MIDILNAQLIEKLNAMQSDLTGISEDYRISGDSDLTCVRCSGSAGRYVYEKNENKKPMTLEKEEK